MNLNDRIKAFSQLGLFLQQFSTGVKNPELSVLNDSFFDAFYLEVKKAEIQNRWFIEDNVMHAIQAWADLLDKKNLEEWTKKYNYQNDTIKIGVIQAGNIPLVGFHDFLSVIISGHHFVGKTSSKDDVLPKFLSKILIQIDKRLANYIDWQPMLKNIDAIIATGSDNSSRYFEYYFGKQPNIIRKNRSSWAILNGQESEASLKLLGEDIFRYYSLGCRNVSKLFVPKDYDFKSFFEAIEPYAEVYNNNKYANNFDYNQSVYLMNQVQFLQNGFVILKEDTGHHAPLSVIFYEYYDNAEALKQKIAIHENDLQCICAMDSKIEGSIPFGQAQKPELWDYADKIDTLSFLSGL